MHLQNWETQRVTETFKGKIPPSLIHIMYKASVVIEQFSNDCQKTNSKVQ